MVFGVCTGPEGAAVAAAAGFSYIEWTVGALLAPREPEAVFKKALDRVRGAPLPCPVLNCFIPGDLKIVGPSVDDTEARDYVETACRRASAANVDTIVFGSGGARAVPEGFSREEARRQLTVFGGMVGEAAARQGITIVVEPLQRRECNILNGVGECAELVRIVNHPSLRLLVDAYHFLCDQDSLDDITANGHLLRHTHIATAPNRRPPGAEACDFGPFFRALREGGYDGRMSFEGRIDDAATELTRAHKVLLDAIETGDV